MFLPNVAMVIFLFKVVATCFYVVKQELHLQHVRPRNSKQRFKVKIQTHFIIKNDLIGVPQILDDAKTDLGLKMKTAIIKIDLSSAHNLVSCC